MHEIRKAWIQREIHPPRGMATVSYNIPDVFGRKKRKREKRGVCRVKIRRRSRSRRRRYYFSGVAVCFSETYGHGLIGRGWPPPVLFISSGGSLLGAAER